MFQPQFCELDWRLFDPSRLSWSFNADEYLGCLKSMKPETTLSQVQQTTV